MNEIKKLYKNAGVNYQVEILDCFPSYEMITPPFTAEKQIKLIKILAKNEVTVNNEDDEYEFSLFDTVSDFSSFEESLADLTNRMWQDLTEEEKGQIKEILE